MNGALSRALSPQQSAAQVLALVGQAIIEYAARLGARPAKGFAPVAQLSPPGWLTLVELINEFLLAKARAQRSDRYLRQLRVSLKSFAGGRARQGIGYVQSADIERWMQAQDWAPQTQRGYLSDVR